jgi:phage tail-like protein
VALTAWNRELGTTQGRVKPSGFTPPEGTFALVLGQDAPGLKQRLAVGDFVELRQTADFGDSKLVRLRARMRPPVSLPAGLAWRASLRVDGVERASAVLVPGRTRDRVDLAANISKLTGNHELAFRLALTGPAGAYELELPAFYLDAVLMDPTPVRPAVINRDPEPGESQVPVSTSMAFDLTDVGPDGIDLATTQVYVAGALALSGGVFQAGFDGPGSSATNPQADTLRIVVDPVAPFASLQQVPIRVVTRTVGGVFSLDTTWSFRCEDLTAPRVVGAQARALDRVRVSFDEPVKQEDPSAADDALNPASYRLTRLSAPAVDVAAVAVEAVTDSAVEILTDLELTPGAAYRVDVDGVVDLFGNVVEAPNDAAEFVGFVPARPPRRRFDLYQLLPAMNRREDETGDLRRFLLCLQEPTDLLLHDVDRFTNILDADVAAELFLNLMLQDLGNPFPFDLSVVDKRRLLNVLVAIYREKGTAVGIKNAIRFFLGLEVDIITYTGEGLVLGESLLGEDWVLGPSGAFSAYAFEVVVPRALSVEERRRLRTIVEYMRPAHTHLARLVEPVIPEVIDHLELGLSELGETWVLH